MDVRANEDIKRDVNILIYDYILCVAIHMAMHATKTNERDMPWMEETTRTLMSLLAAVHELPVMLQIKVQVFETIDILKNANSRPNKLVEMAKGLLLKCSVANSTRIEAQATTAAVQLCAHAVIKAYQSPADHNGDDAPRVSSIPCEGEILRNIPKCVAEALPTMGISAEAVARNVRQLTHIDDILKSLIDIMQLLPTPILLQLERGRLDGLSRAETQLLKQLVGMH